MIRAHFPLASILSFELSQGRRTVRSCFILPVAFSEFMVIPYAIENIRECFNKIWDG